MLDSGMKRSPRYPHEQFQFPLVCLLHLQTNPPGRAVVVFAIFFFPFLREGEARFQIVYVSPNSRAFGKGKLVMDLKLIATKYLKLDFFIDIFAVLPLPQILIWIILPVIRTSQSDHTNNSLLLILLFQYIPRLYLIFPLSSQIIKATGMVTKTAWAGAAYNLLLYMLASHIFGGFVILNPRAGGPEASLIGIHGLNQGSNNLTLKGWPLTVPGLDQLQTGLLQQKPFMQGGEPFHQLQMLTPQHQQQLMLAQQNLTSSANDVESRRLRMVLNNRNMTMGKDALSNSVGDVIPNMGSPLQGFGPVLPRTDPDMLLKLKLAQLQQQQHQQQQQNSNQQQQQQQLQQHALSSQQSQSSNHNLQPDKMMGTSSVPGDGSMSNSFRVNDQASSRTQVLFVGQAFI